MQMGAARTQPEQPVSGNGTVSRGKSPAPAIVENAIGKPVAMSGNKAKAPQKRAIQPRNERITNDDVMNAFQDAHEALLSGDPKRPDLMDQAQLLSFEHNVQIKQQVRKSAMDQVNALKEQLPLATGEDRVILQEKIRFWERAVSDATKALNLAEEDYRRWMELYGAMS